MSGGFEGIVKEANVDKKLRALISNKDVWRGKDTHLTDIPVKNL